MSFETWLFFVGTETVLCFTPGPAVMMVLSLAFARGHKDAGCASAGVAVANLLYFLLSATGLGAMLVASWELFTAVKWCGAAYLCWIGLVMLFKPSPTPAQELHSAGVDADRHWTRAFLNGFVAQAANPKALLFFIAFVPQFVRTDQPIAPQIAVLAVTSVVIELGALLCYALVAARARRLATRPSFATGLRRVSGGLMLGAAAGLATTDRA
jgi:homoserine/homoserine lactone efflux protein